jgi:NTE family protein
MTLRDTLNGWLSGAPARRVKVAYRKAARDFDRRTMKPLSLNLALQGGGVLGAFTWGVLDRLSHERALDVKAITGASAGALNAALFASGYATGGASGARAALKGFWGDIADASAFASLFFSPAMLGAQTELWRQAFGHSGALSVNPLRSALAKNIDIEALRAPEAPALFVSATHVTTATARIFTNADITIDALLASACLPNLHPTVWIDGEPYWDGGFSANPALAPLARSEADRTLLVRLIQSGSDALPKSGAEVDAYMKNLLFNRSLDDELARLGDMPAALRDMDVIALGDYETDAQISSRPTPALIRSLHEKGEGAAEDYLATIRSASGGRKPGGEKISVSA